MSEQSQTAKFIAVVAENLPEMTTARRQWWINHPQELQNFLAKLNERRWTEENGVITFTLPATDGTTGEQWIARTEKKGNRVGDYAKQLLLSKDFKPTTGKVYTVKVLKGELFSDSERVTKTIRAKAKEMKLGDLPAEAACLIRENFTDEELEAMGLWWIVVMHEPIKDSGGDLDLLDVRRNGGGRWLDACFGRPSNEWRRADGFAFSASQD
jgi:hypothetical protein